MNYEARKTTKSGWTTSASAQWVNELVAGDQLTVLTLSGEIAAGKKKEAFRFGSKLLNTYIEHRTLLASKELSKSDFRVWLAIVRKTIRFGKVAEKIPRSVFVRGQLDDEGQLASYYEVPVLIPVASDDRNLNRALNSLRDRKWIVKRESDYSIYGKSSVYLPCCMQSVERALFSGGLDWLCRQASIDRNQALKEMEANLSEMRVECADLY